jgi:molybdopterin molybdotransferase/putative molybdopterin biosynthesis protein
MPTSPDARTAARQTQFLNVISRDEATQRFHEHLRLEPLGTEQVSLADAHGRVLSADVVSGVDVPAFDRSNVDGFAVHSADTLGAMEESPRTVRLNDEVLSPGVEPRSAVAAGTATPIATGGMLPRGADAVVMVEHTELLEDDDPPRVEISRAAAQGQFITFAGSDVAKGQTVLWAAQLITSREIGLLAAIGRDRVDVYRRPRVAVISTGDEIVPPGNPLPVGSVYDSNAHILASAVRELGGEPVMCGTVPDSEEQLQAVVDDALNCDMVVLSGGTSKGAGDLSYRVVSRFNDPGIVAHGVALKPGKPICLAVTQGKPVVILPGFPTSAVFTFHEFVAPVIRAYAGRGQVHRETVNARLPHRVNSDRGRTEYLLVGLLRGTEGLTAYPMGKGSGSVTTFSLADGFLTIDQQTEIVEADTPVTVTLLDPDLVPADLVVVGSHCVGLDLLLGLLRREGLTARVMHVGSTAGLKAAQRGDCDVAGIHLLDPQTDEYNRPFLTADLELIPGYRRTQCFVFRAGDARFTGKTAGDALAAALADTTCTMVNRNAGSGTRILLDQLLDGLGCRPDQRPAGYGVQPNSHNAVAAAVQQGRADWGLTIETVARDYGLEAIPVRDEHYDFVMPKSRIDRTAVQRFIAVLESAEARQRLDAAGFHG